MALEAVVFQQDLFGYNSLLGAGNWSYDYGSSCGLGKEEDHFPDDHHQQIITNIYNTTDFVHGDWDGGDSMAPPPPQYYGTDHHHHHHPNSSSDATNNNANYNNGSPSCCDDVPNASALDASTTTTSIRAKRRRSKSRKNKEEIENQRMTHIAVERNRRKQMNEYLSILRSLMPESYVQRGDQASIIGGAINFVKELEQRLQFISSAQKETSSSSPPFADFFTFPQYSTNDHHNSRSMNHNHHHHQPLVDDHQSTESASAAAIADIEVTMVESHANLKIRSKRRPAQLLKVVSGLTNMRLSILHLNVTTVDDTVLYSLSVKVEDDCKLTSVDDIATAVNQLLGRIQEDFLC